MRKSTSGVLASGLLVLLAGTAALSMAPPPVPGELTLPATDNNRARNNPAKEAIRARQAQEKDKADEKIATEDIAPPRLASAPAATLPQRVDAALRNDPRTATLGLTVKTEESGVIRLFGEVPSTEVLGAAIEIATRAADGGARVQSRLVVVGKR